MKVLLACGVSCTSIAIRTKNKEEGEKYCIFIFKKVFLKKKIKLSNNPAPFKWFSSDNFFEGIYEENYYRRVSIIDISLDTIRSFWNWKKEGCEIEDWLEDESY